MRKLDKPSKKTTNRDKIVILGGRNYRMEWGSSGFISRYRSF
jgi:hypothetical protein